MDDPCIRGVIVVQGVGRRAIGQRSPRGRGGMVHASDSARPRAVFVEGQRANFFNRFNGLAAYHAAENINPTLHSGGPRCNRHMVEIEVGNPLGNGLTGGKIAHDRGLSTLAFIDGRIIDPVQGGVIK